MKIASIRGFIITLSLVLMVSAMLGVAVTAAPQAVETADSYIENVSAGDTSAELEAITVDVWDGSVASSFGGGKGTESNPYLIYTGSELAYLAKSVNSGTSYYGKYVKLMNNIDLDGRDWTPIGNFTVSDFDAKRYTASTIFQGEFDGNFKTISNLKINKTRPTAGLFANLANATIKCLEIVDADVYVTCSESPTAGGILCGIAKNTEIYKCHVSGTLKVVNTKVGQWLCSKAGLFVGKTTGTCYITDCYAQGSSNGDADKDWNAYVGGLVGSVSDGKLIYKNTYYNGKVYAEAQEEAYAGGVLGITGNVDGEGYSTVTDSFMVGEIKSYGKSGSYVDAIYMPWTGNNLSYTDFYYNAKLYKGTTSVNSSRGTYTSAANLQNQSWIIKNLGWDFNNTWMFDPSGDYKFPMLQGFSGGDTECRHSYKTLESKKATCTEVGYTKRECTNCANVDVTFTPALGHSLGDWKVTVEPTCTESGLRQKECVRCTYVEVETLPALGHEFDENNKCIRCGIRKFMITVHYLYSNGTKAFDDVIKYYLENTEYSIPVPEIKDYIADYIVVSGKAEMDMEYTITYVPVEKEKIVKIFDVDLGNVEYNTSFHSLGLPSSVSALTKSGKTISLKVVWDSSKYNAASYGKQTIEGNVLAAYGYEFVCENKAFATLNVCENIICEIPKMNLGRLPLGISYDGLGLPGTAAVITKSGSTYYLPVEWDAYSYNSSVEGKHTISGRVTIEKGFVLADGLENKAYISFELSEKMYGTADIVFLIDTTGSMWGEIQNVKNNINMFADNLEADGVSTRWALLEYRDITCDGKNSTKIIYNGSSEWYIDVNSYKKAIASLSVNGGGDREETVIDALKAATYLEDREEAVTFYIVVTDADYKVANNYGVASMSAMISELVSDETVASCVTKTTYYKDYRPMTDATGGILANIDGDFAKELLKLKELISERIILGKVTSIEITNNPYRINYISGDRFDGTGMVVTAYFEGGESRIITGYTVEPHSTLSLSDKEVTVSYRGASTTLKINVTKAEYPVTGISLSPASLSMVTGQTAKITASVKPSNATNKEVFWYTSNPNVAVVDDSGLVTAIGGGKATITAITADGGFAATVGVTVTDLVPITEIYLDTGAVTLEIGEIYEVRTTVYPEKIINDSVEWYTDNASVVSVTNGRITALAVGTATVTAKSKVNGIKASVFVTVVSKKNEFFTITYDANFGSGAPEAQTKTAGKTLILSDVIPERDGFMFMGWATVKGGKAVYNPGDMYDDDEDMTLYAAWKYSDITKIPKIYVDGVTGRPGTTVGVKVRVKNNPGVAHVKFGFDYDNTIVLSSVEKGSALSSMVFFKEDDVTTKPYILFYSSEENDNSNGTMFTFNFKIPEETPVGKYSLKLACMECFSSEGEAIEFEIVDGYVNVIGEKSGDVNGDGKVDLKDLILIKQYCAGKSSAKRIVDKAAADLNGDGVINDMDVHLLSLYCTGWDVLFG